MPELVRLYIRQVALGFALSAVFVAGLLWLNVANLGHLVLTSDMGLVAGLMLWVFNGIVLAAVQFGIRIMGMAQAEDEDDDRRGGLVVEPAAIPVPVGDGRRG